MCDREQGIAWMWSKQAAGEGRSPAPRNLTNEQPSPNEGGPLPPTPSPKRRGGASNTASLLLPLSWQGRGLGGGVLPTAAQRAPTCPAGSARRRSSSAHRCECSAPEWDNKDPNAATATAGRSASAIQRSAPASSSQESRRRSARPRDRSGRNP